VLTAVLETFRRIGAQPWVERTETELRAAGLTVAKPEPDVLAELTPQQQQVLRFAAQGLTNREIGERLFLSPRTVASHLYRTFPRLGIANRSQLRDIIDVTTAAPT
jgi:DNA-binding NarL/FixJ family response regulator